MNKKKILLFILFISLILGAFQSGLIKKLYNVLSRRTTIANEKDQELLVAYDKLKKAVGDDFIKSISNLQEDDFKAESHEFQSTSQDKTYKIALNESGFYAGTLMYKKEFKFSKEDIDHFFNAVGYMLDYQYLDYIFDHYYAEALVGEKFDCVLSLYLLNRFKKYLILVDRFKINAILMRVKKELNDVNKYTTLQKLEIECLLPKPMIDITEIQKTFQKLQSPLEFKKLAFLDYPKCIYLVDLMRQHFGSVNNEMKSFLQNTTQKLAMLLEPDGCLPLVFGNNKRRNYRYEVFLANKYLSNSGFSYIANGGLKSYKGNPPDNFIYEDDNIFSYRTNWNIVNIKNRNYPLQNDHLPFMVTYNRASNRLSLYGYNRTLLLIQLKETQKKGLQKIEDSQDEIKIVINDLNITINKKSQTIDLNSKALIGSTAFVHLSKIQDYEAGVSVDKIEKSLNYYNEYTEFIDKPKFTIECDHSIINENDGLHKDYYCSFVINSNQLIIEKLNELP